MRNPKFKSLILLLVIIGIVFILQTNNSLANDLQAKRKAYISKLMEKRFVRFTTYPRVPVKFIMDFMTLQIWPKK